MCEYQACSFWFDDGSRRIWRKGAIYTYLDSVLATRFQGINRWLQWKNTRLNRGQQEVRERLGEAWSSHTKLPATPQQPIRSRESFSTSIYFRCLRRPSNDVPETLHNYLLTIWGRLVELFQGTRSEFGTRTDLVSSGPRRKQPSFLLATPPPTSGCRSATMLPERHRLVSLRQ